MTTSIPNNNKDSSSSAGNCNDNNSIIKNKNNKRTLDISNPVIIYQGTLLRIIQKHEKNEDATVKEVDVQLRNNGLIVVMNRTSTSNDDVADTQIDYFLLTPDSICQPIIRNGQLMIDLQHLLLCPTIKKDVQHQQYSLQFRLMDIPSSSKSSEDNQKDDNYSSHNQNHSGNVLSIGYTWINCLENAITNLQARHTNTHKKRNNNDDVQNNHSNSSNRCIQQLIYKEWVSIDTINDEYRNDVHKEFTWTSVAQRRIRDWWHNELSKNTTNPPS